MTHLWWLFFLVTDSLDKALALFGFLPRYVLQGCFVESGNAVSGNMIEML